MNYNGIKLLAEQTSDLEKLRVALGNRYERAIRPTDVPDKDGICRGLGLDPDDPVVKEGLTATLDRLIVDEQYSIKQLEANISSEWKEWVADPESKGIGLKTLARLLGAIGDPYWHYAEDRPRTVSELWAYCGLHVINGAAPKRVRGQQANWSTTAGVRAWLIAQSIVKVGKGGPYRALYDTVKAQSEGAAHKGTCIRCGPSGKPAQAGSPLSDGHRHAQAMRRVMKAVLKDLWIESRAQHDYLSHKAA